MCFILFCWNLSYIWKLWEQLSCSVGSSWNQHFNVTVRILWIWGCVGYIIHQWITCSRWPTALALCGEAMSSTDITVRQQLKVQTKQLICGVIQCGAAGGVGIRTLCSWGNEVPKETAVWQQCNSHPLQVTNWLGIISKTSVLLKVLTKALRPRLTC